MMAVKIICQTGIGVAVDLSICYIVGFLDKFISICGTGCLSGAGFDDPTIVYNVHLSQGNGGSTCYNSSNLAGDFRPLEGVGCVSFGNHNHLFGADFL